MKGFNIKDFQNEDISINILHGGKKNEITLKFTGRIDALEPQKILSPFFDKVHQEAVDNGIKTVICDIKDLHFINSSGIKCLIIWMLKIPNEDIKKQYKMNFMVDNSVTWQKNSIGFLKALLPDKLKIIET